MAKGNNCFIRSCFGLALLASAPSQATPTVNVIWSFNTAHQKKRGTEPFGGLVAGPTGELFGTASGYHDGASRAGSVFKLTPPTKSRENWLLQPIMIFNGKDERADGAFPLSTLVTDSSGALYGTTSQGGGSYGVVFKLSPPAAGQSAWTYSVLAHIPSGQPTSGLLRESNGTLFGMAQSGLDESPSCVGQCGVVFEVVPPKAGKTKWQYKQLYVFQGGNDGIEPAGILVSDTSGVLYGTTSLGGAGGQGTVFSLAPSAKGENIWTENELYAFQGSSDGGLPLAGVTIGDNGVLYGTASAGGVQEGGCGTVYSLTPPTGGQTAWSEATIYTFMFTDGCHP
jgi:uncharacterized repeat protein (TIGR03803 family)